MFAGKLIHTHIYIYISKVVQLLNWLGQWTYIGLNFCCLESLCRSTHSNHASPFSLTIKSLAFQLETSQQFQIMVCKYLNFIYFFNFCFINICFQIFKYPHHLWPCYTFDNIILLVYQKDNIMPLLMVIASFNWWAIDRSNMPEMYYLMFKFALYV